MHGEEDKIVKQKDKEQVERWKNKAKFVLLRGKHRKNFYNFRLGNDLLDMKQKAKVKGKKQIS